MNVSGLWWRPVTGPLHEPEVRARLR